MIEEPDTSRVEAVLRDVMAGEVNRLAAPIGVYESVRRRRARQLTVIAAAAVAVVAVVAVGTSVAITASGPGRYPAVPGGRVTASTHPTPSTTGTATAGATSTPASITCSGDRTAVTSPGVTFAAQHGVRGGLGSDPGIIAQVLAQGWQELNPAHDPLPAEFAPGDLQVLAAQRAGPEVVALVRARSSSREAVFPLVVGRELESQGVGSGPVRLPADATAVSTGAVVRVCGSSFVIVVASAGVTATLVRSSIAANLAVVLAATPVTLDNGAAAVTYPSGPSGLRFTKGGVRLADSLGIDSGSTASIPDRVVSHAFETAPATVNRALRNRLFGRDSDNFINIFGAPADLRVLGGGKLSDGRPYILIASILPNGAAVVWDYLQPGADSMAGGWVGLLKASALDRTVFAWRPSGGRGALTVVATKGVRAEALRADGTTVAVSLTDGSGSLPDGGSVRLVRVYDQGGALIGQQKPGAGLTSVPMSFYSPA